MIHCSTLRCGAQIAVEPIAGVRSAALSWLIPAGGAFDEPDRLGRAAVTSELLLRGAGELDSRAAADAFDLLGASRSVSPGSRFMRLGATMLGNQLNGVLPLLVDIALSPRFDADAVEPARALALQAIESLADDPQQRAVLAARARHHQSPFDRSGLGSPDGIARLSRDALADGWRTGATPHGSIITVAGCVDPAGIESQLNSLLDGWCGDEAEIERTGTPARGFAHKPDDSNQVQIIVVHDAPTEPDERSILERVVIEVLSGGMSGRLFTEVREKRGLCYAVHAGYRASRDLAAVTAYVGTTPERAQESLVVLLAELERINTTGISPDEFARAMTGLTSRLVFSGESTAARAGTLASDLFNHGRTKTLEQRIAEYEAVTLDQVNAYLHTRDLGRLTIQTLGPIELSEPRP